MRFTCLSPKCLSLGIPGRGVESINGQLIQRDVGRGSEECFVCHKVCQSPQRMDIGREERPCKAVCYRAGEGIGETVVVDRKQSGSCLPESRSGVVLDIPGRKRSAKYLECP